MAELTPGFTLSMPIQRPVAEVFAAVVDPAKLSSYFTKTATVPLEPGARPEWTWPGGEKATVIIDDINFNKRIVLRWPANWVDYMTHVEFTFREEGGRTIVSITESGWRSDSAGLTSSYDHCGGWQHMLMCLKAWLVHGIDLRE